MADAIKMTDLTGKLPEFKRGDRRYMVFQASQVIDFGEPAFANTIKVHKIGGGEDKQEVLQNSGWKIRDSLKAVNAISEAKLEDPNFSCNLVTGIAMSDVLEPVKQYEISVEYQGFYRELTAYPDDGRGPLPTPGLLLAIVKDLQHLKYVKDPVTDVVGDTLATIQILDEDYTGKNEHNHIHDEEHQVNVPANQMIIRPANGSFYHHDLVLTHEGDTLEENKDYIVRGVNHGKTRVSFHKSGVYEYIILTSPIVGTVQVDYRAFGGEITAKDFYNLRDHLLDILALLNSGQFVTEESLPEQPVIQELEDRLDQVEEALRHYKEITFKYDIKNFKYNGIAYSDNNWVDVAEVAHGPWSEMNPIVKIASGYFRLEVPEMAYNADFTLTYDMNVGTLTVSDVSAHGTTYEHDGLAHFTSRIVPKFRIAYDSKNVDKGFILQMSINGRIEDGDDDDDLSKEVTVRLFDKTGSATVWDVYDTGGEKHPNTELETVLPDETKWIFKGQTTDGNSAAVTNTVSVLDGNYTSWVGSINITDIEDDSYAINELEFQTENNIWLVDKPNTVSGENGDNYGPEYIEGHGIHVNHVINNNDIDISQIRGIKVKVFDRYRNQMIVESSNQVIVQKRNVEPIVMYYIQDLCALTCSLNQGIRTIKQDGRDKIITDYVMALKTQSGTNSLENDRFVLKQIDLLV